MESLIELFAEGLGLSASELSDDTSPENTPEWDSLAAMNLVSLIEEAYDIELSTRDIMKMRSIGTARSVLRARGVDAV